MANRFNWSGWDNFDTYRTDDTLACDTYAITASSGTSGTSGGIIPLTGCAAGMPPRIDSFNIIPSSLIEIRITNWK